jgi:signal transduction histidine kinase
MVKLLRSGDEIRLEVNDEGHGMSKETQTKFMAGEAAGVGLPGMQERLKLLAWQNRDSVWGEGHWRCSSSSLGLKR